MNYYYLLIPLFCCIILIITLYIKLKENKKLLEKTILEENEIKAAKIEELKNYFKEEWEKERRQFDLEKEFNKLKLENQYELEASQYNSEINKLKIQLQEKEKRYNEVNQDLDLYREGKIKEIDGAAAEYEQRKQLEIANGLENYRKELADRFNDDLAKINETKEQKLEELSKVQDELEEERVKRAAINEEIRRQRQVEMEQDFYRIQFSDEDRNDVEILRDMAPRLRHPEAINKVIWTAYYQKPLTELRKRVAIESSGIYKITRIKTGEIYIGQAVNVSTRWAEHCKAALGVGTLASSQLHRVMAKDGPEQFTFEVIEKVDRDKLKERESFYIDFYDSKNYGLNTVRGEQNK